MLRRLEELQDVGVLKRGALAYIPGRGPRRLGDLQQLGVPVGGCIGIYTHIRIFEINITAVELSLCLKALIA